MSVYGRRFGKATAARRCKVAGLTIAPLN